MTPKEYKEIYKLKAKSPAVDSVAATVRDNIVKELAEAARDVFDCLPHDSAEQVIEDAMKALAASRIAMLRKKIEASSGRTPMIENNSDQCEFGCECNDCEMERGEALKGLVEELQYWINVASNLLKDSQLDAVMQKSSNLGIQTASTPRAHIGISKAAIGHAEKMYGE